MFRKSRHARVTKGYKNNGGFTLVEVLTSIAILSIVSVSILRAFTLSANMNRIAREMDSANAVCIETAEKYSNDPTSTFLSLYNDTDITDKYVMYYNQLFERDKASTSRISPGGTDLPSEYRVIIDPTETDVSTMTDYYYPEPAFSITATNGITNVELTKSGASECELNTNPGTNTNIVYSAVSMTAMVPIHVDCSGLMSDTSIKVKNLIGKLENPDGLEMTAIADIYLYNIPALSPPIAVEVDADEGTSTSNIISLGERNTVDYSASIQVERLSDGRIMAQYVVNKYWIKEVLAP